MLLLMAATALAVAPCAAVGQDQQQPLRFLGNKAIAPFISLEDGKPVGIVVDLAYALADKAGLSISVEAMDWPTAQSEVLHDKADALLQINPDAQREQIFDFSDTLLVSKFQIFRKATRTDIQSLASLRGKKVGVESGGFPAQQLGAGGGFQLVLAPTWTAAFILLNTNQIDAVIVDRWVGEYELAVNRFDGITVVDAPVSQNYSRIAVKKGNRQLLDKINIGLESIKQDGTYQRIMDKWQPKEVVYFTKQSVNVFMFFAVAACVAILIGIAIRSFAHARTLKKINIKLTGENAARRAAETGLAASHRNLEGVVELRTMELRRSEERLRLFIDRAPAAIAMFDSEMCYLVVSRRFITDQFPGSGMEPANLVGRSHYELFPDWPERWREVHRRVLAGETLSADDDPFQREDGSCEWVRWEMAPWYRTDGMPGGAVLFSEVTTPRKRAEEALRQSEARFRAAVQALSGILWTNNAEGEMAGEQAGWAALTGQSQEDYQGYGWAKAVHPDDAQPTVDAWNESVAGRRPFVFEHRVRRHDGAWRRFSIRAVPVLHQDGTVREWVGVHTDITEQREAEAELADLNRKLEERVREEMAAREDAQTRAAHAQRMQALGQLAGGIAHDFNNILQAVQSGGALIEKRAADAASVRRFARTVVSAAERGAAITRRLLSFARRGDLRAERIDPAGLLDGLRDVLAQTLGSPINVCVEGGTGLAAVMADRGQLETVLVNLATNARDAMPDGGTLTLAAATEEVTAAGVSPIGLKPGQYVRLAVADTGTGMDRTTLERAMEPFFTTKPQDKGTGLGLPMAKGFAEQSGGGLAIESAPGEGTTVTIWLPVADVRTEAAQIQPGLAPVAGLARRVLVVDDEDLVREVLVASLEEAGFAVLAAGNGAEALALLEAEEPVDALVTDLSMPGMGGLALIREAQVRRPGLPAVLLTGYAGEAAHLAVSGAPPGAFSLLRKPVSVAQLVDRIEMVLAARTRTAR
jgi:PAS domain S-box-containing protein